MTVQPYIVTRCVSAEQREADALRLERAGHVGEAFQLRQALPTVVYREAFATLEDAAGRFALPPACKRESMAERADRANVYDALRTISPPWAVQGFAIALDLLNGDGIEVAATTRARLRSDLNCVQRAPLMNDNDELACAAWNAEHGIGIEAVS